METELKSFYKKYQKELEDNYPGINFFILNKFYTENFTNFPFVENHEVKNKLRDGVPFDYITNKNFFYDLELFVDQRVLIPRFETEVLVDESIKIIQKRSAKKVVDVGVGSGAIALNILKKCPCIEKMYVTDISTDALDVFNLNLESMNISNKEKVDVILGDRLDGINERVDFIVSNPPYIKNHADSLGVHKNTDLYEPHIALYLDDDIYSQWFKDFFTKSFNLLNPGGYLFIEGHEDHLNELKNIGEKYFNDCYIMQDLAGRDRFLLLFKEQ